MVNGGFLDVQYRYIARTSHVHAAHARPEGQRARSAGAAEDQVGGEAAKTLAKSTVESAGAPGAGSEAASTRSAPRTSGMVMQSADDDEEDAESQEPGGGAPVAGGDELRQEGHEEQHDLRVEEDRWRRRTPRWRPGCGGRADGRQSERRTGVDWPAPRSQAR